MNLETIVNKMENTVTSIPWWAKVAYYEDYSNIKKATEKANALAIETNRDNNWYIEMGECYNEVYSSGRNAIDKTLTLYESIIEIPFIGSFVENIVVGKVNDSLPKAGKYVSNSNKKHYKLNEIPEKENILYVFDSFYEAGLKWLTSSAAVETDTSEEKYWSELNESKSETKTSGGFIDYLIEGINSLKELMEDATESEEG